MDPAPLPSLATVAFPYVELAALMVAANVYILVLLFPRPRPSPTLATIVLVVGLLVAALGLWGAAIYAVLSPSDAATIAVFLAANSMMSVAGAWLIALFYRAEEHRVAPRSWTWPGLLALLFLGNELLMGVAFVLAIDGSSGYVAAGTAGLAALVSDAVDSVWFFWAMLANMVALVLVLPLPRPERALLFGLASTSAVGPFVVLDPVPAGIAMAAIMGVVVVLAVQELRGARELRPGYVWSVMGVFAAFGAMGGGEVLFLLFPGPLLGALPFALGTLLVMGGEFAILSRWAFSQGGPTDRPVPPIGRPLEDRPDPAGREPTDLAAA
ncbi:MAG TPA: hypothetical protein VMH38_01325 [Thermoplasmata archaeon]|nr:hypothetical protein [Thermoplasmata archaeon]